MRRLRPSWRTALLGLFLFAALVRVVFVASLQPGFYFWDSVKYDRAAVRLINEGNFGPEYDRSPAYPLFLAGIYLTFGQSILTVRLVESLLGGLIAVLIAMIGKRILGGASGLAAGLIWALYPLAVFLAGLVYPETLITVLLAGAVTLLLSAVGRDSTRSGSVYLLLAGFLLMLSTMAKPVVAATLLGLCAWLALWKGRGSARPAGLLIAGFCLPLALWAGISSHYFGKVVLSDPRTVQFIDKAGSTSLEEVRKGRIRRALEDPARFVLHFASEFAHFWQIYPERVVMSDQALRDKFHQRDSRVVRKTVFSSRNSLTDWASMLSIGPVFLLAIAGIVFLARQRQWSELSLLLVIILSFAIAYSFFFTQLRYRIPVEPYIILLAGHGLMTVGARLLQGGTPYNAPPHMAAHGVTVLKKGWRMRLQGRS
ncbi:MAG: glycosyltransferase family 39 protein [Acidobacteriota bacterium]